MKKFLLLTLFNTLLFSASSEEIEQYLSLSKADSEIIAIEQVFDSMRAADDNSTQEINQIYSLYLEEHLSSNELQSLLKLYRTPIMQRYVIEMDMLEIPRNEMKEFLVTLEENPLSSERLEIIENLLKLSINDEQVLSFYRSMTQRYQKEVDENNTTKQSVKKEKGDKEKAYLKMMKESTKNSLLYGTQVLSMEEMKELNTALKSSILKKVSKVESAAMVAVMNGFISGIKAKVKPTTIK